MNMFLITSQEYKSLLVYLLNLEPFLGLSNTVGGLVNGRKSYVFGNGVTHH